mmetsp:Transcript_54477/g.143903  ORF Transcript_54477/g.143903 Transcript_54477/m.143903 type:complete len:211 (+) Transcript_54477:1141-1773(+)
MSHLQHHLQLPRLPRTWIPVRAAVNAKFKMKIPPLRLLGPKAQTEGRVALLGETRRARCQSASPPEKAVIPLQTTKCPVLQRGDKQQNNQLRPKYTAASFLRRIVLAQGPGQMVQIVLQDGLIPDLRQSGIGMFDSALSWFMTSRRKRSGVLALDPFPIPGRLACVHVPWQTSPRGCTPPPQVARPRLGGPTRTQTSGGEWSSSHRTANR